MVIKNFFGKQNGDISAAHRNNLLYDAVDGFKQSSLDKINKSLKLVQNSKYLRIVGMVSSFVLIGIFMALSIPTTDEHYMTDAAAKASSTTLTVVTGHTNTGLDLLVENPNGTFATSSDSGLAKFGVSTDNYTGYTVAIRGTDNTRQLTNSEAGTALESIVTASGINATTFDTAAYNGKWGLKPSKYNSVVNTDKYFEAPTASTPAVLDVTSAANSTVNDYTIGVGARVDRNTAAGDYKNTFMVTAVANAVSYTINYADSTGDSTVKDLPSAQSSTTNATSVTLAPNKTPTRSGYTFSKWCLGTVNTNGNPGTTCTGNEYVSGNVVSFIDQTTASNVITLYAVWTPNTYDITIKPSGGVSSVSLNGTNCTNTAGCTVSGLSYNNTYNLSASVNSGYSFSGWSNSAGIGTIANSGSANTTYTVGLGSTILTAEASDGAYIINLTNTNATTPGSTTTTATYGSSNLTSITNPQRQYTVSGFSTSYNNASGASVSSTAAKIYTYGFNGWYTNTSGGTRIINTSGNLVANTDFTNGSAQWNVNRGTTLYAQWANGTAITLPTISKTGYTCGWGTSNSTSTIAYASGYSGLKPTSNLTLYGVCTPNKHSLTINFVGQGVSSVQVRTASGTGGTLMGTVSTSGGSVSGLSYNTAYYLRPIFSSGYQFNIWARPSSAYGTLSSATDSNPTYTIGNGDGAVTIKGMANSSGNMQNWSSCSSLSEGNSITLTDTRDSKNYTVTKINGNCWMTDDLKFTGTSLSPSDTNVTTSKTISYGSGTSTTEARMYQGTNNEGFPIVLYNFAATSAMTITGESNYDEATQDICPKDWRLPTHAEQATLGTVEGSSTYVDIFAPTYTGLYLGVWYNTDVGYWWSSTAYDGIQGFKRHNLNYWNGNLYSGGDESSDTTGRSSSIAIRCISANGGGSSTQTMQDFSNTDAAAMVSGETKTLKDSRDGKSYTVAKINGNVWMTQNLAFTGASLSPSSSNVASNTTLTYGDLTSGDSYTEPTIHDSGRTDYGVYYNYVAATAGTIAGDENSTDATYDVCPKGWRLPTYSEQSSIGNYSSTYVSAFSPVYSGFYSGGTPGNTGIDGFWWSSTAFDKIRRYVLNYTSQGYTTSVLRVLEIAKRYGGYPIRCIKNIVTMQGFTTSDAAAMSEGETSTLKDVRDDKTYTVAKINGNVWMTQNLAFTGTSLDPSTSNVAASTTLTYGDLTSGDDYTEPRIHVSDKTSYGVYYNFAAASAGTIDANSTTLLRDAVYDICPKGWKLPTVSQIATIADADGSSTYYSAFSPVPSGRYMNGSLHEAGYSANGYWWSATAKSSTSQNVITASTGVRKLQLSDGGAGRDTGASIRCIKS